VSWCWERCSRRGASSRRDVVGIEPAFVPAVHDASFLSAHITYCCRSSGGADEIDMSYATWISQTVPSREKHSRDDWLRALCLGMSEARE